jgi:acetyl esterase/lipase
MTRPTPHVRGPVLQSRFEWVRRRHGAESVGRVLDGLSARDRRVLEGVERDGWYPLSTFLHLEALLVRMYGHGEPALAEALGADSARTRLEWLRAEAALISVHALLTRTAEDFPIFFDFGDARYARRAFTAGAFELSGFPHASPLFCRSYRGYLTETIRLHGAVDPLVDEEACQARGDERCVFVVRWLAPGSDSSSGRR